MKIKQLRIRLQPINYNKFDLLAMLMSNNYTILNVTLHGLAK